MAYTPTEWETGDVITAAKLNNMEQGIEDAFVAPAVTIADEGDVLTVNSSGEWVAEAPAGPVILEGDIVTSNGSDYTFTLTSGNVEDLVLKPDIYMKATVKMVAGETETILAVVLLKLDVHGYYQGNPFGYIFSAIVPMSSHVYYAHLTYAPSYPMWAAELTVLD